jgi:hypothetical protein
MSKPRDTTGLNEILKPMRKDPTEKREAALREALDHYLRGLAVVVRVMAEVRP